MTSQQIPVLIFLVPFIGAFLAPLAGFLSPVLTPLVAILSLLAASVLALKGLLFVKGGAAILYPFGSWLPPYGIEWRLDSLSALMALLVCTLSLAVILSSAPLIKRRMKRARKSFYICVLLLVSGLLGMVLTHDLFNLFVFLEVSSLAAYALIATGGHKKASYASFRYLLIGSLGASLYLLGVGYLYAATGTLNMGDMAVRLAEAGHTRTVSMALLLIFLGLSIKMGLFPFHGWLPDAYTYASDTITSLIAPIMTKVAIYSMIRIFFWVFGVNTLTLHHIFTLLLCLGMSAIAAGSAMAFIQQNLKRLLAYSSVAHIGLLAVGIGLNNATALTGTVLHIVDHAFMKACLFLILTSIMDRHSVQTVDDLARLKGRMPWTFAFFIMCSLSMVGVPPFAGFFSKWYIVLGALQGGHTAVAFLIVASSLLSALYFFRVIEKAFFEKAPARVAMEEGPVAIVTMTGVLAVSVLLLGLFAPAIFNWGAHTLFAGVL